MTKRPIRKGVLDFEDYMHRAYEYLRQISRQPKRAAIKAERVDRQRKLIKEDWEETMTPEEAAWCMSQITERAREYHCSDSYRAARAWKKSQVRRFKRLRSCCGSREWVAYRWNPEKGRNDKYILGFNYGH